LRPTAGQVAAVLTAMLPDLVGAPVGQRLDRPPPTEPAQQHRTSAIPPAFPIGDEMFGEQLYSPPPKKRKKWVPVTMAATVLAAAGVTTVALVGSGSAPAAAPADPVTVTAAPGTATVTASAPSTAAAAAATTAPTAAASDATVEQYLSELRPVEGPFAGNHETGNVAGKAYLHTVATSLYECSEADFVEYNISKGYRKFVAAAGLDDNSSDSALKVQLEVFGDGKKLTSTTFEINKLTPIDLDVTQVLRLKISWQPVKTGENCGPYDNYLDLGEAKLLGVPGEVPTSPTPTS
jgi:hypothetical protein